MFDPDLVIGRQLAAWGKVILLETRGRVSGKPVVAAVGFIEGPGGLLSLAAGDPDANWALNLRAHPAARATRGGVAHDYLAEELSGAERGAVIAELIMKYGTPAERLGRGPAFRLVPSSEGG